MLKVCILALLLALGACERHPPPLNEPASNAPVWDLNVGRWEGTNTLKELPTVGGRL
jgi:hypothetical protein